MRAPQTGHTRATRVGHHKRTRSNNDPSHIHKTKKQSCLQQCHNHAVQQWPVHIPQTATDKIADGTVYNKNIDKCREQTEAIRRGCRTSHACCQHRLTYSPARLKNSAWYIAAPAVHQPQTRTVSVQEQMLYKNHGGRDGIPLTLRIGMVVLKNTGCFGCDDCCLPTRILSVRELGAEGAAQARSPRMRRASWMSLGMMVTRLA
jgi:hypothetical protein